MSKIKAAFKGLGLGALLMYFYDPDRGETRRNEARHRVFDPLTRLGDNVDEKSFALAQQTKQFIPNVTTAISGDPTVYKPVENPYPANGDWNLTTRLLMGGIGGWLAVTGLRHRGPVRWLATSAGTALLARSVMERNEPHTVSSTSRQSTISNTLDLVQSGKRLNRMINNSEATPPVPVSVTTATTPASTSAIPIAATTSTEVNSASPHTIQTSTTAISSIEYPTPNTEHRSSRLVRDVMNRSVHYIHPDDRIQTAAEKMKELNIGALPVYDGDRIIGMMTEHDIITRATAKGYDTWQMKVSEAMTDTVIYAHQDQALAEAQEIMRTHKVHHLVVLDDNRKLVGFLTETDILGNRDDGDGSPSVFMPPVSEPLGDKR